MNQQKISKLLSFVLRHHPDRLGLTLDHQGWVAISDLLEALRKDGKTISLHQLQQVVTENDKQRFTIDATQQRIRANQGHSIPIDLALEPTTPPVVLYHGTAERHLPSIQQKGLLKGTRQHVHLSADQNTAHKVGSRHGKPIILVVDTAAMLADRHLFYCSENGVWLIDHVPVQYLQFPS